MSIRKESGENYTTDYLDLDWPRQPLPPDILSAAVLETNECAGSLRDFISTVIFSEAILMEEVQASKESNIRNKTRSSEDIAIAGFKNVGVAVLEACKAIKKGQCPKWLIVDPAGLLLLNHELDEKKCAWKRVSPQEQDPEIIGFKQGMERYLALYKQAISYGAKPDKHTVGTLARFRLRFGNGPTLRPVLLSVPNNEG